MITFKHNTIDYPKKIVKDIDVNDAWKIDSCTFDDNTYIKTGVEHIKDRNETAFIYTFRIILTHKKTNKKSDLYALSVLCFDNQTKQFKNQTIRYYTMYDTKIFKSEKSVPISEHLKMSLNDKSLDSLFPGSTLLILK